MCRQITRDSLRHPEGSVLVDIGDTTVVCTASIEDKAPSSSRRDQRWVTAEYGMLPRSTDTRTPREHTGPSGPSHEVQRLVGRSLRAVVEYPLNRGDAEDEQAHHWPEPPPGNRRFPLEHPAGTD